MPWVIVALAAWALLVVCVSRFLLNPMLRDDWPKLFFDTSWPDMSEVLDWMLRAKARELRLKLDGGGR